MIRTGADNFSLSATHSARLRDASRPNTSSSSQETLRNSNAPQTFGGSSARNASNSARSFFRFGGSWNSSAPSLSPSVPATSQNPYTRSPQFLSRLSCVIRRGAFSVSLYGEGICAAQPETIFSFGIR